MKKKIIAIALCAALAVGGVVAGSLAFLTDTSEVVTNTFTAGDVGLTLEEHLLMDDGTLDTVSTVTENKYHMIPGTTLNKDPFITIDSESEDCWVFVKVEYVNGAENYLSYTIDSEWTALDGVDGVYYRNDGNAGDVFNVLKDKQVKVLTTVTSEMMETLDGKADADLPQLKFTAYAVQKDYVNDAATAWGYVTNPDGV